VDVLARFTSSRAPALNRVRAAADSLSRELENVSIVHGGPDAMRVALEPGRRKKREAWEKRGRRVRDE
jgi:hypothetical protein